MRNIRSILIMSVLVGGFFGYTAFKVLQKPTSTSLYTIGILQTASHPALDAARNGFMETLKKTMGSDVSFILYNAEGSPANAHTIAQRLHAQKNVHLIYAIASPALQAIASVEKNKPILFTAVTDPKVLGITPAAANICGISDMIDMHKTITLLSQLTPHVKTAAILFNNAESNSIEQVQYLKKELGLFEIAALEMGIVQESDIPSATMVACRKADAIIVPTDNTLACAMELVASIALEHKKPLFSCFNQAVHQGALAACGVDYYDCGKEAATMAYEIIVHHQQPQSYGTVLPNTDRIYINKKTLNMLGLNIHETLIHSPITII